MPQRPLPPDSQAMTSANTKHRIAIAGASGRMGQALIQATLEAPDMTLVVALDHADSTALGNDASAFTGQPCGVAISNDLQALRQADTLIDFTRPEGTLQHLKACREHGVAMVIGTTGFDAAGQAAIQEAAATLRIVFAPNMSVGVNVTLKLLDMAARILNEGYDVEVFEAHHRRKVDAPSGTALKMGDTVARAWGQSLDDVADWARHGHTGEREDGRIGFSVMRGGDIVGDHTVTFAGIGERIEITHRASSRATYAQGSLRAVRFLAQQPAGLYSMQEVLGLS